jgi:hypothetical protein
MLNLKIESVFAAALAVILTATVFAEAIVIPVSATGAAPSVATVLI